MNRHLNAGRPKILHVISGLTTGGAEMMLYKLAVEARAQGIDSEVACLGPRGGVGDLLRDAGIPVHFLGLGKNLLLPFRFGRLVSLVRRVDPDVLQGWMYQGNLAATVAARLARSRARVFWSVHQSLYSLRYETFAAAAMIRLSARLSRLHARLPEGIVYVSRTGADQHAARGFPPEKAVVIPIGFDTDAFHPVDARAKAETRLRLGLDPAARIAGWVARPDPKKDPENFLRAAARVAARFPDARFVMLGRGLEEASHPLRARARALGLGESVLFRAETRDVAAWMQAFDVLVSSSYTEGFPNVLGEAMACGVPCVATDVGDAARLLDKGGLVVPPRSPESLADAVSRVFSMEPEQRELLGGVARARIRGHFSIAAVARLYAALWISRSAAAR